MSLEDVEAPQLVSLELDAEHGEENPWHLERRPGPSLVPAASLYDASPAVISSRRAFKRAFLSLGGSSTSSALSFPWLLGGRGVTAGGLPCTYVGAFAACMAASDSSTAAFGGSPCGLTINRRVWLRLASAPVPSAPPGSVGAGRDGGKEERARSWAGHAWRMTERVERRLANVPLARDQPCMVFARAELAGLCCTPVAAALLSLQRVASWIRAAWKRRCAAITAATGNVPTMESIMPPLTKAASKLKR